MPTASSIGAQKLGHPVPLSNFVSEEKSSRPQPAQTNCPSLFSTFSGLRPRALGPVLAKHLKLFRRQGLPPFLVGVDDVEHVLAHASSVMRRRGDANARQNFLLDS